jgi:hypothetical protein
MVAGLVGFFAVLVVLVPAAARAGSSAESLLGYLTEPGHAVSLGLGVSALRPHLVAPSAPLAAGESGRPADVDPQHGTALSVDLRLRWPGVDVTSPVEPYVTLGPALFVVEPDYAARSRLDPSLQVGAKVGAGVNWRLGKATTLFGAYEVTTAADPAPGARSTADPALTGYDFTYGLRVRY